MTTRIVPALIRFHRATGVRLSLRALVPMAAVAVAMIGTQAEPGVTLARLCRVVTAPGFDPFIALIEFALVLAVALWSRPRLASAGGSWLRHLPATDASHRLALIVGLVFVQAPLLIFVALAAIGAILSGDRVGIERIGSVVLIVLAVSWAAAPRDRRARTRQGHRWSGAGATALTLGRISARALGWHRVGPLIVAIIPMAACVVLLANNHLDGESAASVARLCSCLSVALVTAGIAEQLVWRRPAWPWVRSLPWSSYGRILADAWFLGKHALPSIAVSAIIGWRGALTGLLVIPLLAVRGSGFIRTALSTRAGAAGRLMTEGFIVSGLVFLSPWSSLLALAATPWAIRAASTSERDQRVTRWIELRHLAEGDTGSWSGR